MSENKEVQSVEKQEPILESQTTVKKISKSQYCTNCGELTRKKVCPHCGVKRNNTHNYCAWCGASIDKNAKKCPYCQEPIKTSAAEKLFMIFSAFILIECLSFTCVGVIDSIQFIAPEKQIFVWLTIICSWVSAIFIILANKNLISKWTHGKLKLRMILRIICVILSLLMLNLSFANEDKKYYQFDRETAIEKAIPYAQPTTEHTIVDTVVKLDNTIESKETEQAIKDFYGLSKANTSIVIVEMKVNYADKEYGIDYADYTVYFLFDRLTGEYIPFDKMCFVESTKSFTNYKVTFHMVQK